jgi:pyridoxamine 5'-phosphate oxidase
MAIVQESDSAEHSLRRHLRAIPSLVGNPLGFDPSTHPSTPQELFLEWFRAAEDAGIPEPHAMTVATVDADGLPDSRMLVLKDLTQEGAWCFAGRRDSAKGRQLAQHPAAALMFSWREQVRSVRIRGPVVEATAEESRADFLARHMEARAVALSGRQSTPVDSRAELIGDVEAASLRLSEDPALVPEEWTVWRLEPIEVEFWEGSRTRLHARLRYERTADGWHTAQLRP